MQTENCVSYEFMSVTVACLQWRTEGGVGEGSTPPPHPTEIPKALQNRAKFNPIVKTVKKFWI